jgi:ketosteroid isomerase-like protein
VRLAGRRDTWLLMQTGVELVSGIIEALNRGDIDAMLERMHPDFVWRPIDTSPVAAARGHREVRRYVEDWLGTFESLRVELDDATEIADCVVVDVHGHGRGCASGLAIDTRFCQVWTVHDGAAAGMREYATRERALDALGSL